MGKRGPPRLPSNVVKLRGKAGHTRPINEEEPKFDGEAMPSEKVLKDKDALKIWNTKTPELIEKGLLTFQDSTAFSTYCLLCAMRDRLWQQIKDVGEELAIAKGFMKAFLATDVRCDRWSAKFGLSPSDRSSIKATPREKPEGARKFLA
jgi:phage terminase small subunit